MGSGLQRNPTFFPIEIFFPFSWFPCFLSRKKAFSIYNYICIQKHYFSFHKRKIEKFSIVPKKRGKFVPEKFSDWWNWKVFKYYSYKMQNTNVNLFFLPFSPNIKYNFQNFPQKHFVNVGVSANCTGKSFSRIFPTRRQLLLILRFSFPF